MGSKNKNRKKAPVENKAPNKAAAVAVQAPAAKFKLDLKMIMLISALIGGILFVLIYGVRILNPLYDDWLFAGGDLTQHYVGWIFFRRSELQFPLGLIDGLLGDIKTSVLYMDSIPILAMFFKILSPILPKTFQYFGLMGLMSFMLSGASSSLLIYRFNKNGIFCIIGSTLYVVCPAILQRLYGHEGLACHFLIILGFVLWAYQNHQWKKKWQKQFMAPILWGVLGIVAVGTHMYFVPMIYCAMLGCFITDTFLYKKPSRALFSVLALTLTSLISMWLLGAFYGDAVVSAQGLGVNSANINTFWNPLDIYGYGMVGYGSKGSIFFDSIPVNNGQYEGYAYIGLGIMLGIVMALTTLIVQLVRSKEKFLTDLRSGLKNKKAWIIAVILIFIIAMFYAISPSAYLNATKIYDIYYSERIINFMSSFRATGRFAWVGMYLIFTAVLYILSRIGNKKLMIAALTVCVALQFTDMGSQLYSKRWYKEKQTYVSPLSDPRWEQLAEGCDKLVSLPYDQPEVISYAFGIFAMKHDMTISHFHVARPPLDDIINQYYGNIEKIRSGNADPTALYVFLSDEHIPEAEGLKVYELDGYYVVKCPNQYDPLEGT